MPSFGRNFHKEPFKFDFSCDLKENDTIYVLLDKSCHLFLHIAKPRTFGNLWKPDKVVILKGEHYPRHAIVYFDWRALDVGGILDSEYIVLRDTQWEVRGFKKICVDFGGLFLRNAT